MLNYSVAELRKDKKPYYCWGANQDELSMEPLENYLKP